MVRSAKSSMLHCGRIAVVLALGGAALAAGASSARAADAGAPPSAVPACMQVSTESRYVPYGYTHVVILKNGCTRAAACTVSTDVNPEPQSADVPAAGSVELTTFRGSPASTFTPRVSCRLR